VQSALNISVGWGEKRRRFDLNAPPPAFYAWVVGASVLLAALSLRFPSTPTYDPWAWVIWGKQLLHLQLSTLGGPTWKPLPIFFTLVFAPFGSAAPDLWLIVARAGGIMAVAMAFMLGYRLTALFVSPPGAESSQIVLGRWRTACLVFAGAASALGVVALSLYVNDVALGDSEGLLLALMFAACLRHLDGAPVHTFALLYAAALDRAEVWPLLLLYALYLYRTAPDRRNLVLGSLLILLPLWLLPELIGSGSLLRGVKHAVGQDVPGTASVAGCPFCSEVFDHAWPLVLAPFKVGTGLLFAVGAWGAVGHFRARPSSRRAALSAVIAGPSGPALTLASIGIALVVEEAVMTQFGFSGNDRYLILASATLIVAGAIGWYVMTIWVGSLFSRLTGNRLGYLPAVVVSVLAFVALSPHNGSALIKISPTLRQLRYQAQLRRDMSAAVAKAGGADALERCGTIASNPSDSPLVSWTLGVDLMRTESLQGDVLITTRSVPQASWLPVIPQDGRYHVAAHVGSVWIYADC
jgi:hypothetical protein